jgi:hypothetical protein
MIPKSEWVWYGFPGHLVVSRRCAYHLCTRIGDRLISTVGAYYPSRDSEMENIAGPEEFFETMVFRCFGENEDGDPIVDFDDLECTRYKKSIEAERGHRAICDRIAKERHISERKEETDEGKTQNFIPRTGSAGGQ